jgi:putative ABC transport system permease protein
MGNITLMKEESRDAWAFQPLENFFRDLRYAFRILLGSPGFTAVAIITLALGIGANTAMFSVVNRVLFQPLPYKDPERLLDLWRYNLKNGVPEDQISYPDFLDLTKQNGTVDEMAAYREDHGIVLAGRGEPERLRGLIASANLFDVLGATPALGRGFRPSEDQAGKEKVVVLSHQLWRHRFQSDPNIIGHSIALDGDLYRIVGIMPQGFQFPISAEPPELWVPISFDGGMTKERGGSIYNAIARLKAGVSVEQASARMNATYARLISEYPRNHIPGWRLRVVPELSDLVHDSRNALLVLFAAVGMVLLIACANVANLLLARGASRTNEIAVRAALGASRVRVACQLLIESLVLALLGGLLGLVAGYWAIRILAANGPRDIPRLASVSLDGHVFAFALLISLLTSGFFGLLPTLRISKVDLTESLGGRSEGMASNRSRSRMRDALIISEIALSLVTVLGAGLLLETLWHLERANPGFDAGHVLTFSVELPEGYSDSRRVRFYEDLLPRVRALPGVSSASAVFPLPFLSGIGITTVFDIEGRASDRARPTRADLASVEPGYFRAMRIPLIAGQSFGATANGQRAVAVINKEFVRRYFPNQNPIGQRIKPDAETRGTPAQMAEIVGVVNDTKSGSLRENPNPVVFVPHRQLPIESMDLVVRTLSDPRPLTSAVRAQVQAVDGNALLFSGRTLAQYVGVTLEQPRFNALLLVIFAALALVLTTVGVYGAVSYAVAQRVHEIGIRTALGATPRLVLKLVLGSGVRLILIGVLIGMAAAVGLTRLMSSMLFGVSANDPAIIGGVVFLLVGVALAACYLPARRALRVDPIVALRYQ